MHVKEPSLVMINGRRMAYDEVNPLNPKGTILLLTGLGSKRLGWYKQLQVLGRPYRTIALDHRDTGDSDLATESYTTGDMADDAAAVLRAIGVQRAHVVGISLGGCVALQMAVRHPKLVDKLVLVATSAGGSTHVPPGPELLALLGEPELQLEIGERTRRNYARIAAPGYFENHPDDWNMVAEIARYHPQSPAAYFRQAQAGLTHDVSRQLDDIQAPTLVVHGEVDPLVVPANGCYLAQHIKGARLLLYPNTGHILIVERAADFNRDVLAFLDS